MPASSLHVYNPALTVDMYVLLYTEIPSAPHILDGNYLPIIVHNRTSTAAEEYLLVTLKLRMPSDAASFDFEHFTVRQCTSKQNPSYSSINVTLIDDSTEIVAFPMKVLNVGSNGELCVTVSAVSKCLQEGMPSISRNISELNISEFRLLERQGKVNRSLYIYYYGIVL